MALPVPAAPSGFPPGRAQHGFPQHGRRERLPPGLLGETAAPPAPRKAPSVWLHLPPHADAEMLGLLGCSKGRFAGLASALAGTKLALQAAGGLLSRGENAAAPPVRVRDCPCPCSEEKKKSILVGCGVREQCGDGGEPRVGSPPRLSGLSEGRADLCKLPLLIILLLISLAMTMSPARALSLLQRPDQTGEPRGRPVAVPLRGCHGLGTCTGN